MFYIQGDATSEETGPSAANTGSYYYFFETTSGATLDTAVLESNVDLLSRPFMFLCLSSLYFTIIHLRNVLDIVTLPSFLINRMIFSLIQTTFPIV